MIFYRIMYPEAKRHFKKVDPVLYTAAQKHKIDTIRPSSDIFGDLTHAIVNQQLSGKAAETIYGRLRGKIKEKTGKSAVTPQAILKLSTPALRSCGLSGAKVVALKSLSGAVTDGTLELRSIHAHPDKKVMELLTSVKGIGPWTAEMILMFSLGRTNVFSKGDLGLRKGIMRLYGLRKMPSEAHMDRLARAWSPYRTYAARILWRVADEGKNTGWE